MNEENKQPLEEEEQAPEAQAQEAQQPQAEAALPALFLLSVFIQLAGLIHGLALALGFGCAHGYPSSRVLEWAGCRRQFRIIIQKNGC